MLPRSASGRTRAGSAGPPTFPSRRGAPSNRPRRTRAARRSGHPPRSPSDSVPAARRRRSAPSRRSRPSRGWRSCIPCQRSGNGECGDNQVLHGSALLLVAAVRSLRRFKNVLVARRTGAPTPTVNPSTLGLTLVDSSNDGFVSRQLGSVLSSGSAVGRIQIAGCGRHGRRIGAPQSVPLIDQIEATVVVIRRNRDLVRQPRAIVGQRHYLLGRSPIGNQVRDDRNTEGPGGYIVNEMPANTEAHLRTGPSRELESIVTRRSELPNLRRGTNRAVNQRLHHSARLNRLAGITERDYAPEHAIRARRTGVQASVTSGDTRNRRGHRSSSPSRHAGRRSRWSGRGHRTRFRLNSRIQWHIDTDVSIAITTSAAQAVIEGKRNRT